MILARAITKTECPWLDADLPEGTVVHRYDGCTYGCIGAGIAVSKEPGKTPFFEIPRDAVAVSSPDRQ